MQTDRIQPRQCFYLRSGEVIRVNSLELKNIHCDIFDDAAKRWIALKNPLPNWTLYAPCADPTTDTKPEGKARRWWNAMRQLSHGFSRKASQSQPSQN